MRLWFLYIFLTIQPQWNVLVKLGFIVGPVTQNSILSLPIASVSLKEGTSWFLLSPQFPGCGLVECVCEHWEDKGGRVWEMIWGFLWLCLSRASFHQRRKCDLAVETVEDRQIENRTGRYCEKSAKTEKDKGV